MTGTVRALFVHLRVYKKQGWGVGWWGDRIVVVVAVVTFRRNAQHIDELLTIFC